MYVTDAVADAAQYACCSGKAQDEYMDDDDRMREPLLRALLASPAVRLDAHPGVEPADVQHLFLGREGDDEFDPIFACLVVTEARVEEMLASSPYVAETFSLQVARGRTVTRAGTLAAFEAWVQRVFPDVTLPTVMFSEHGEPA